MESSVQSLVNQVEKDDLFSQWIKNHPKGTLTHLFCTLSSLFVKKTDWEIGYFDQERDKITVFVVSNAIAIKPEDDVFKKEQDKIEFLNQEEVMISFDKGIESCKRALQEYYSHEALGDGFVVLQTLGGVTSWNFTFITRTLQFLNIRISAKDGSIVSHKSIKVVDQYAGTAKK